MAILLFLAFVIGALTVVALELLIFWIIIRRLSRNVDGKGLKNNDASSAVFSRDFNCSLSDKEGFMWILEADKVPTSTHLDRAPTERRRKNEILAVTPVKKYARLKDHCLSIHERDSSSVEISLCGCTIVAVSASSMSSRKWAKRYPIKVECNDSNLYKGSAFFYIYLETSWEKEAWCKALRLSASDNDEKIIWFSELTRDFQSYLASLSSVYSSYFKPSADSSSGSKDNSVKLDNTSSKVRQFLKKLAKKTSKIGNDYKGGGALVPGYDERKTTAKSFSFDHSLLENDSRNMDAKVKTLNIVSDDIHLASSNSNGLDTQKHFGLPVADANPMIFNEGALCLNMLVSRLFFDLKNNSEIMASIQSRIQRTLSNMRIPSYIGEVVCTAINPGTLPPHIVSMRALPSDLSEVWSMEVSFEYLGGMILDIEIWLGIQELENEGESAQLGTNSGREATSDLLEGLEHFGEQLNSTEDKNNESEKEEINHYSDLTEKGTVDGPAPSHGNRWKSMVHRVAKHVSQVPLSMALKISSLNGTIQLSLKPPPSDQIWFGFTSMPDIEFNVENSVGEVKITSGRVSQYMINRIKSAIRDTLVLPNYESLDIPWMLAEKDNWIPRRIAPYAWYRGSQDSNMDIQKQEPPSFQPATTATATPSLVQVEQGNSDVNQEISENSRGIQKMTVKPMVKYTVSSNPIDESALENGSLQELRTPLLNKDKMAARNIENKSDVRVDSPSDDDSKLSRISTRERMRGLGKQMGEKLEVKRRHIEEKGRSFVEKMRRQ